MDVKKKEWMEAVALVFDYFRERTPRSFVEAREATIVWNYKNADIEFGRLQARARFVSRQRQLRLARSIAAHSRLYGAQVLSAMLCLTFNMSRNLYNAGHPASCL